LIVTDNRVAAFVGEKCGVAFIPPWTCMGIERDGEIIGGVVFNVFEGADVHMSVAGKGWSAGFLAEVGHYAFDILKAERITAITEQPKIVRLSERLGGQLEGLMRNHFGKGRDAFLIGFLRDEWKF
jgi:RimJ/RimL family protein N-acetyltransferase